MRAYKGTHKYVKRLGKGKNTRNEREGKLSWPIVRKAHHLSRPE